MKKFICIHGHFYQPPRENPWIEAIEIQESAYPFENWNLRINYECYAANAYSRILDSQNRITEIINNYSYISFNFGPTLLTWIEQNEPKTYQAILKADQDSQKHFSGHGSAMAQAYNHMIMPLANERDKQTQVIWGIRDFEYRFKRFPEGMWLPETAVDLATLECLAQNGIKFTVLAPYQAKRARIIGQKEWQDVQGGKIDPKQPYTCHLPSGKTIALFFYDGPISHDIAFGGLLNNGEGFANRFVGAFANEDTPQLVHIATDGESYGHHHKFGNMALSYGIDYLSKYQEIDLTNFGEFLKKFPPRSEVEIVDISSWSCAHGVKRWSDNCGCRIGSHPKWNQKWRFPLREAMDWLRDQLISIMESQMSGLVKDPWGARNEYINLILDNSLENIERNLEKWCERKLSQEEKVKCLKLLEMQKNAMFMYTSCGWFFDEISGIETKQIIQYAARAIQLAKQVSGKDLENEFSQKLEAAESNIPAVKNGKFIYDQVIKPTVSELEDIVANYAICSLFYDYPQKANFYAYSIENKAFHRHNEDKRNAVGEVSIRSDVTLEKKDIKFLIFDLGGMDIHGFVADSQNLSAAFQKKIEDVIAKKDLAELLKGDPISEKKYTLWDLFLNERSRVVQHIFNEAQDSIEKMCRQIYDRYCNLMHENAGQYFRISLPRGLTMTIGYIFEQDLIEILRQDELDMAKFKKLIAEMKRFSFFSEKDALSRITSKKLRQLMEKFVQNPKDEALLKSIIDFIDILQDSGIPLNLWQSQNVFYELAQSGYLKNLQGDPMKENVQELAELLSIAIP